MSNQELYYYPKNPNEVSEIDLKLSYLPELCLPIDMTGFRADLQDAILTLEKKIHAYYNVTASTNDLNQDPYVDIREIFDSDPEAMQCLENIKGSIYHMHSDQLVSLSLILAKQLRINLDVGQIWSNIQKVLWNNLHQMTVTQLARTKYAFSFMPPKRGERDFHKALLDLAKEEMGMASVQELMIIYTGFRGLHRDQLHSKIIKEMKKSSETVKRLISDNNLTKSPNQKDQDIIDLPVNLFYTYTNARLQRQERANSNKTRKDMDGEAKAFLDFYLEDILESFDELSPMALLRLVISLRCSKLMDFGEIYFRLENRILEDPDVWMQQSPYVIAHL